MITKKPTEPFTYQNQFNGEYFDYTETLKLDRKYEYWMLYTP